MESDDEFNYTWNVSANLSSNSGHFQYYISYCCKPLWFTIKNEGNLPIIALKYDDQHKSILNFKKIKLPL